MEPMAEIPVAWEFIRQLPEKKCKTEVKELITTAFDHLSEAHTHMSSYAVNMSSLTKITDPDMFQAVLKATAHPLIQVNIPDRYLNPVEEPQLMTTAEERLQKLEKVLLLRAGAACLVREPRYGLTGLLATAVWLHLKCKYFNSGMAKEACEAFEVRAKQLSKLLSGKVYLGRSTMKRPAPKREGRPQAMLEMQEKCEGPVNYQGR